MAQAATVAPVKSESKPIPSAPSAAAAVAAAPAVAVPRKKRQLSISNFKPTGHFSEPQQVLLPADWTLEETFEPGFWASIAPMLQSSAKANGGDYLGTELEVRTTDHRFFARLIVTGVRFNTHGVADGLVVDCVGPACDPKTGAPCPYDLKAKRPMPLERQ
jgi:hypothetical protein